MMNKMVACKTCGKEMAATARVCPHCGAKNKKPIFGKWWFWAIVAVLVVGIAGGAGSETGTGEQPNQNEHVNTDVKNNAFSGDCGIAATAEMGTDIIGQPTVTVSITNTTDKDISAIKFYAVPMNVYGEELKGIFTQNQLDTDDTIPAGASETRSWQFLDNQVKTVKLYVYSVFFSDGTQWGDKDATKSVIMKNGLLVEVSGRSEN